MEQYEWITSDDIPLALIIRSDAFPEQTTFVTPPDLNFQVGFVVYAENQTIARHVHRPIARIVREGSELLILKKGRCLVNIYNDARELIATRDLRCGDLILLLHGGHGFDLLEDTTFIEVKQGPYAGIAEKERF